MNFNKHSAYKGSHSFLSASKYHWLRYDDSKLETYFLNAQAAARGTRLHAVASECIDLNLKMPRTASTFNLYVNDAINFKMNTEQVLYYSDNCFGTADAISFRNNKLRIHDLKTGTTPAHIEQLEIYSALFFLEYGYDLSKVKIELRIYQNDEVLIHKPKIEEISDIMNKIVHFDSILDEIKNK